VSKCQCIKVSRYGVQQPGVSNESLTCIDTVNALQRSLTL